MKFSEVWLREWVSPELDTEKLADQLTMAGLEVKGIDCIRPAFSGVVAARIKSRSRDPRGNASWICEVDDGVTERIVVCGAANVRVGMMAALARPGARLPTKAKAKDKVITDRNIGSVQSQGMLCSATELGLLSPGQGILELGADVVPGEDLAPHPLVNDQALDLDITPNRGDCLSHYGLAQEIAALNRVPIKPYPTPSVQRDTEHQVTVEINDYSDCPRYMGCVISDVDLHSPVPLWLTERLYRCDLRSVDPAVDITNYVMLECGQPLHAFALSTISGGIRVRRARAGEKLTLLNGALLTLDPETLLITDDSGPIAVAGIMGGMDTAVRIADPGSKNDLFLECASFSPAAVAGRARSYGLTTDAAHRYERGVDMELAPRAMARAMALLQEIVVGRSGPITEAVSTPHLYRPPRIELRQARLEKLLGFPLEAEEVLDIFAHSGFALHEERGGNNNDKGGGSNDNRGGGDNNNDKRAKDEKNNRSWVFSAPGRRFDITREADLIEEVARCHGYDNVPLKLPRGRNVPSASAEEQRSADWLRERLCSLGCQEIISYSFVNEELQNLCDPAANPVRLKNPISQDMSVMRSTLLPGLLQAASLNLNRQQDRVLLFEVGNCFHLSDDQKIIQIERVSGLASGARYPENWSMKKDLFDFYDLKGLIENLFSKDLVTDLQWRPTERSCLRPGQGAEIFLSDASVGFCGQIHPRIQRKFHFKKPFFIFELQRNLVIKCALPKATAISPFPLLRRDLAFLVNREVSSDEIRECVINSAGSLLQKFILFDVYEDNDMFPKQKSIAIGLQFQRYSRTLTDQEVAAVVSRVVRSLSEDLAATLRH